MAGHRALIFWNNGASGDFLNPLNWTPNGGPPSFGVTASISSGSVSPNRQYSQRRDFPFARSLIVVRSTRTLKKTGHTS